MPKQGGKRVFISFEYERDHAIARNLEKQARGRGYPARVIDLSLSESYKPRSGEWENKAHKAIQGCQLVVVMLGQNTHNAPGVATEIEFAKKLGKQIIQLRPQGSERKPHQLLSDKPVIVWKWKNLDPYFDSNYGKH